METAAHNSTLDYKYIIGIDEVGRGPIAGPVAVGAFIFLRPSDMAVAKIFEGVKDSKALTTKRREEWFDKVQELKSVGLIDFRVCFESEKIIDEKGIVFAIKRALQNSLSGLTNAHSPNLVPEESFVYLDGGLVAPKEFVNQETIIKGDTKIMAIALASICAKVLRDKMMVDLALKYPEYGFEDHKGYGTKKHYAAIKEHGLTAIHRRTYI